MEHGYGIGITNRYSCFLESDDDSSDTIKVNDAEKDKKKGKAAEKENRGKDAAVEKSPTVAKKMAAPNAAPSQNQRKGIRDLKGGSTNEQQQRPNRYPDSGDRGFRGPRPERQNTDNAGDRRPPAFRRDDRDREYREERNNRRNNDETREFRGEGRERGEGGENSGGFRRGGFRGNRGGAPFARGRGGGFPFRKREFDRQSGSDKSSVKPIDKREGAGSRNWGTYKDDALIEPANPSEESMDEKTDSHNTTATESEIADADKAGENGTGPPAEEGPKQMTLGEWKALQEKEAQNRPKPVFNLRKAGEGEDQSQWKNLTLKTKEKVSGNEEEEEEEEYSGDYPQRAGRQKQFLDINFHFADSRRGMNERSGFSGPPRGGMRGDRQRSGGSSGSGTDIRGGGGRGFGSGSPRGGGAGFRGGYRGGRGYSPRDEHPARQTAPKVDDERDFPSLG